MSFDGEHAIAHGDVLAVLRELPSNEFDGLICDPPYGFSFMGKKWDYDVPSVDVWREALRVLKPGAPLLSFGGARTFHRVAVNIEDAGFEMRDVLSWMYGSGFPKSLNLPGGFGTALKPAWEPCMLARKPLDGTVANNVAKWGVGALAIDASRVGTESTKRISNSGTNADGWGMGKTFHVNGSDAGRWPANVILDEEAGAALDAQTGDRPSTPYRENTASGAVLPMTKRTAGGYSDNGGPSRFFYCSKVSTKEREYGCDLLPMRSAGEVTGDREEGSAGLDSPRAGAGRSNGARNSHPTLKPLALARWLATLIKPPSPTATLLVPFSGAGSEIIGALEAGWPMVFGIEGEQEYIDIAHARIAAWRGKP